MSERDRPASGPLADDAGGLRFDTFEDAVRFTRQGVERSNRFMAAQGSTPAKFYEDGHFDIKVELCAGKNTIDVSVLNERGAESLKERMVVHHKYMKI